LARALPVAAKNANGVQLVTLLLDKIENSQIDIKDSDGKTALENAVKSKNIEVAKILLLRGAVFDQKSREAVWLKEIQEIEISPKKSPEPTIQSLAALVERQAILISEMQSQIAVMQQQIKSLTEKKQ